MPVRLSIWSATHCNRDTAAHRALVDTCRRNLDERSICTLPEFIRPDAMPALVAEAQVLAPKCYRKDNLRTPYSWMCNEGFPPHHPRSQSSETEVAWSWPINFPATARSRLCTMGSAD